MNGAGVHIDHKASCFDRLEAVPPAPTLVAIDHAADVSSNHWWVSVQCVDGSRERETSSSFSPQVVLLQSSDRQVS